VQELSARIAIDIGGTFTDLVLVARKKTFSLKLLTTHERPEQAVIEGCLRLLDDASLPRSELSLILHGTTLATNAIIERKGARTALFVTKGHRDSLEAGYEDRFEQYDLALRKPDPLVPRHLRWPVEERIDAKGKIRIPLDEASVSACLPLLARHAIESIAVGLLHSYVNPQHEQLVQEILRKHRCDLPISLSFEVCPEIREYERLSTTAANAYIKPLIGSYLARLRTCFTSEGIACPMMLMLSSGGLTTVETAQQVPIRLIESGPAGGAALASSVARQIAETRILSFDMGGTTAKICFVDNFRAQPARLLEVARQNRFIKGSGLPLRGPARSDPRRERVLPLGSCAQRAQRGWLALLARRRACGGNGGETGR
jgi:N-methylhydantoinase A